ncbi:hypothetical protein QTP86_008815 [Hemibagrus guttatus]|nr:hypothetical protein QTP86_008815 [Hemibagrus guttatus]
MKCALCCLALLPLLLGLSSVDAKGTFYGNPYRFNLYKAGAGPHFNPGKPMTRHKITVDPESQNLRNSQSEADTQLGHLPQGVATANHLSPPIPIFCILNPCTH